MPKQANRDIFLWGGLTAGLAGLGYLASQRTPEPFQSSDALYYSGFKFYGSLANFKKGCETPLNVPLTGGGTYTKPALNTLYGKQVPFIFSLLLALTMLSGQNWSSTVLNAKMCILDVSANTIVYDTMNNFNTIDDILKYPTGDAALAGFPEFPTTTEEKHYILYFNVLNPELNGINSAEVCYKTPETDTTNSKVGF